MVAPASTTFAVITGGGTSGHVVPAIAIAELLVDAGHHMNSLHYVGSNRGAEVSMIPALGLAHTFLSVDGLQFHRQSVVLAGGFSSTVAGH